MWSCFVSSSSIGVVLNSQENEVPMLATIGELPDLLLESR